MKSIYQPETSLENKIENVEELVNNKVISAKLGTVIMRYLIKKDASKLVRQQLDQLLSESKRAQTSYM